MALLLSFTYVSMQGDNKLLVDLKQSVLFIKAIDIFSVFNSNNWLHRNTDSSPTC